MTPALAPYVDQLWFASPSGGGIERVLPTGAMHVVIRLDSPLVLLDADGARDVGHAVLGGARSSFYERDITRVSRSVGAMLRPGAAQALFGIPASEVAHRHTRLDDLILARTIAALHDELLATEEPLRAFERFLVSRLRPSPLAAPVANMLHQLKRGATVATAVASTGRSHRACVAMFDAAVGLGPKAHARVRRFQNALATKAPLADVALANGYADQAHLCRDFAEIAGISPAAHRKLALAAPNHVPRPR